MALYFTADTHFGHKNIIGFCNRPYGDVHHMNESLIGRWNRKVRPTDTVYHLGDFSFMSKEETLKIVRRLNGNIHLVRGNHDGKMDWSVFEQFVTVREIHEIKIDNQTIVMCHYPMLTWNKSHYGSWMLHGHSHGGLPVTNDFRMDVGVDAVEAYGLEPRIPVSFEEVRDIMQTKASRRLNYAAQIGRNAVVQGA